MAQKTDMRVCSMVPVGGIDSTGEIGIHTLVYVEHQGTVSCCGMYA